MPDLTYIQNFGNRDTPVLSALTPGLRFPELSMGLVGAWCPSVQPTKNQSLLDMSGRGNHGTLTNGNVLTAWGPGEARLFDSGDYFACPNSKEHDPVNAFSWCAWVRNTAQDSGHMNKSGLNLSLLFGYPTLDAYCMYINGAGRLISSTIDASVMHHVVAWWDGSTIAWYLNGKRDTSISWTAQPTTSGDGLYLGCYSTANRSMYGGLDDIRIYNRALSQPEISLLARRRGIAYEVTQRRFAAAAATGNRRRRYLIGCQ